jgi:AraC-like DNA-binding protein
MPETALLASPWTAELLLRGGVGALLAFHVVHLMLPGPRPAARAALALFSLSLISYLFCQRKELFVVLPHAVAWLALALCVSATAWLWLAARALFDDRFAFTTPVIGVAIGMVALGLAAHRGNLQAAWAGLPPPQPPALERIHALTMLGFTAAALWEVARNWRDDLVEPRRAVRRWVALGIGMYASVALIVELAVRGRDVGALLPAMHVIGIGTIAFALALLVARRSLDTILGVPPERATPMPAETTEPTAAAPLATEPPSPALVALQHAMSEQRLYRQEGLTLTALAATLNLGEAALRSLINQQLGYRNFNDFLHRYRLDEASQRLAREDLPILTIALECGYGSIGPFNRAFRQRFGMTPTEYRAGARMERHRQAT